MKRTQIYMYAASLGMALACSSFAHGMQPVGPVAPSISEERHLTAELITKTSTVIATTAGNFKITQGVTVDDRRSTERHAPDESTHSKVDLIFKGDQLIRVTIY